MKEIKTPPQPLSGEELARYLRRLAALHRDGAYGNVPLSLALEELATSVGLQAKRKADASAKKKLNKSPSLSPTELARLEPDAVGRILDDPTATKSELVALGAYRYSIPSSALEKRPVAIVRETVRSAYLHEQSIRIINEEAIRQGAARRS